MPIYVEDQYQDSRNPGNVIGSTNPGGIVRQGIDLEAGLSIDNYALRVRRLMQPGWGRSCFFYGPFTRQNGLALIIHILNGHNASQTGDIIDTFAGRLKQWLRGNYAYSRMSRLFRWLLVGEKKMLINQLRYWYKFRKGNHESEYIATNLAVGWFSEQALKNPVDGGNLLFIRSTGSDNGELQIQVRDNLLSTVPSLQNIPVFYLVVLRENGVEYFAATFEGVPTLSAYPKFQLLAIDPFSTDNVVFGGFSQSVLGEIGFRVDTRVYATKIGLVEEFSRWYGSAHAADKLVGSGVLHESPAEIGGAWTIHKGFFSRSGAGVCSDVPDSMATLSPSLPSGLVHAIIALSDSATGRMGLVWRFRDTDNYFLMLLGIDSCEVRSVVHGEMKRLALISHLGLQPGKLNSIQIIDRGNSFQLYLDGVPLMDAPHDSDILCLEKGVGIYSEKSFEELFIHSFEAHPLEIEVPSEFELNTLRIEQGKETVVYDDFQTSGSLENSLTQVGGGVWKRVIGNGNFFVRDGKCIVDASSEKPNPGRTAYTVKWDLPDFADLTVDIQPPGVQRGEGEAGRAGLIFYQDPGNYIIVSTWLDDNMNGASISSFFQINGFEDIYDAVWTNVGNRISFGTPYRLRVTFNGLIYTAYVNDEPVLYRSLNDVYPSLNRLKIHRVGIVANWEWGNDTGSVFNSFIAKARK